ncbi:MAG: hypothetical protein J6I36_10165 [Bacteroidaceae bacterium]|nr:hypothetical protein [Bacteroidaceae bacterium]
MKKSLLLATATAMLTMTACVSENLDLNKKAQDADKGYIALDLSGDDALTTRAIFSTTPGDGETSFDASNWTVSISGSTNFSGTVSQLAAQSFNAATGYTATVSNYANLAAALADNTGDSFGKAFYQGTSETFEVKAGDTSNPSINCGKAQNAKLSIDVSAFSNVTLTSLTISGSNGGDGTRIVAFHDGTTDNTSKVAYFKAEDALTYSIKYKAANNEEKEITNNVTPLQLNPHTSNTLRLTSNATGLITLTISYDDTFDEGQTVTYNIDSATGAQI